MTSAWSQLPRPGITAVLGWCQALIRQGVTGDAAEAAACEHAKTSLLEQIATTTKGQRAHQGPPERLRRGLPLPSHPQHE